MTTTVLAQEVFKRWVDTCDQRRELLLRDFKNSPLLTAHILTEENSVMQAIAKQMELTCYGPYYSTDAILFKDPDDRVPRSPPGTTWVRRIRVAFEHENYFRSGLFQEVSHLLITDCDLRVLVSYPDEKSELEPQLNYLHEIIKGSDRSDQVSDNSSFLFIVDMGDHPEDHDCFKWHGYIYRHKDWQELVQ